MRNLGLSSGFRTQAQVSSECEASPDLEQQKLQQELGLVPLARRCLILHSGKFVALMIFAAAMQAQAAVGLLLLGALLTQLLARA